MDKESNNNKKQPKVTQPKKKKSKKQAKQRVKQKDTLTPCGYKYAIAVANPFDNRAHGSCIPRFPSRDSQKVTGWVRTTMVVGSGGVGFALVSPCLANDLPCLYVSAPTYTPTNINVTATSVGAGEVGVSTTGSLPYSNVDFQFPAIGTANVMGRMVSAGLKVTYSGTQLNMGGTYYAYSNPNHGNLNSYYPQDISGRPQGIVKPVTRKPLTLSASSISSEECEYVTNSQATINNINTTYPYAGGDPVNGSITGVGAGIMAVIVAGTPGDIYLVEYQANCEYVGRYTSGLQSATHANSEDFNAVNQAKARMDAERGSGKTGNDVTGQLIKKATDFLNDPNIQRHAGNAASALYKMMYAGDHNVIELR